VTAQDLIYQALRKCGQIRPGYTSQAELLADGLGEFQAMYDGWNSERTQSYSIPDYIYPIASNGLDGIYGENVQFTVGPVFTFSATLSIGVTTALVANTSGLIIGQRISGTGIPANATIQGISINTSIELSAAATATGATTVTVTPDFVGPRPEAIIRMNLYMTSVSPAQPTRIPLTRISAEEWANISVIQLTPINVTTVFYYDPQFPQGVINVWPPLNGNSLEFFTWGFLTPPTSLAAVLSIPPGYQDAIVYTLAERLWPMCTKSVLVNKVSLQYLAGKAKQARERIKAVNAPMPKLANDFQGGHRQGVGVCDWDLLLTGRPY
jgi:hypothetical protein